MRLLEPDSALVRDSFDPYWSYSIGGGPPHQVLAADYFLQGVPVPSGRHTVELTYEDPKIGEGILISAIMWGAWTIALVAAFVVGRRPRRRPTTGTQD